MRVSRFIILTTAFLLSSFASVTAQEQTKPAITYGQSQKYEIGGIAVEGINDYEDYILIGISGLSIREFASAAASSTPLQ